MCKPFPYAAVLILFFSMSLLTTIPGQSLFADDQNLIDRINQLETEAQALRAQVQGMRQDVVRLPGIESTLASAPISTVSNTSDSTAPAPPVPWAVPQMALAEPAASKPAKPQPAAPPPVTPLPPPVAQPFAPQADARSRQPLRKITTRLTNSRRR